MALVVWNTRYVLPGDRGIENNTRSDMRYGATREGVQKLTQAKDVESMTSREGLNYIANRRGVARFQPEDSDSGDGLFNAGGKADLEAEITRLESHADSTEWRAIVSFTKSDLQRTGYEDPEAFRELLTAKMPAIGKLYGISPENLVWNAAFHPVDKHGRDHHPHYHVYFYSTDPSEGRGGAVPSKNIEKCRSLLTNAIFPDDTSRIQVMGQQARMELNAAVKALCADPDWAINSGLDLRLRTLSEKLPAKGKKTYAFLPNPLKKEVDALVRDLIKQPGMAEAYDKLQDAQRAYVSLYNDNPELIGARMYEWEKHFFHPTGTNDRATVHNQLIRLATELGAETVDWVVLEHTEETVSVPRPSYDRRSYQMKRLADRAFRNDWEAYFWLSRMTKGEDPAMAEALLNVAASHGQPDALIQQAHDTKDLQKRRSLLERAAQAGSIQSLYQLGQNAEQRGNLSEAVIWYEKAAANTQWASVQASLRLASIFANELLDPEKADYYRRATHLLLNGETEDPPDRNKLLSMRHKLGYLFQKEGQIADAFMEYSEAAIYGHENSKRSLVRIAHRPDWLQLLREQQSPEWVDTAENVLKAYDLQMRPFSAFTNELREARRLLNQKDGAALLLLQAESSCKNVLAAMELGLLYETEHNGICEPDPALFDEYYRQAVSQANAILQTEERVDGYLEFRLGQLIISGKGHEADLAKGMEWYEAASGHGSALASVELARIYEEGLPGTVDVDRANVYYRTAAKQLRAIIERAEKNNEDPDNVKINAGYQEYRLGQLLMDGKGVEQDLAEAQRLLKLALEHGVDPAKDRLLALFIDRESIANAALDWTAPYLLKHDAFSKQLPDIQANVQQVAQRLSPALPEDLQSALQPTLLQRITDTLYYRHVGAIVSDLYRAAPTYRAAYRALAEGIRCSTMSAEDLPKTVLEQIARLSPVATSLMDGEALAVIQRNVLQIAAGERVRRLLHETPSMWRAAAQDTRELRDLMLAYSCTKYSADMPAVLHEKCALVSQRIAAYHPEFSEAAAADPERWNRHVWSVAAQQLYAQQRTHVFSKNILSSLLSITHDIGRMALSFGQMSEQKNRTPEQKKAKDRKRSHAAQEQPKQQEKEADMDLQMP